MAEKEMVRRFTVNQLVQHFILFVTFVLLAVTGLAMFFSRETELGGKIIYWMGGWINVRSIHKWSGLGMMLVGAYHVLFYALVDRTPWKTLDLLPKPQDVKDAIANVKYNLHLSSEKPKYGRFSWMQKIEYWGAFWGLCIMGGTGFIIWAPDTFAFLPLWLNESARTAHAEEAILAVLFVGIWHMYAAHLKPDVFPIDMGFFTGKISKERIAEEHPLEVERR